jgi:glutamate dehydrogenase/leucine dehydrogenase
VKFGSTASSSVTFTSSKSITAVAPAGSAGSVDVTVITPGGPSKTSVKDLFGYGAPSVTSFTPGSGITGSTVTVTGSGFVPGMTAKFGSHAVTKVTVVSGTSATLLVPNGLGGPVAISLTDPAGTGTSSTQFTPTLSVSGFTPTKGVAGTVVAITGVGFAPDATVKFNGTAATAVTVVDSSHIQATVPSGATSGYITVTNSSTDTPAGTVTSASKYTV